MSSIDAVSSSALQQAQSQSQSTQSTDPMSKVMSSVANLLGMTTDDLKTAQQNGTSLAQLASQKGVSSDTLTSTLAQALQANAPADAPSGTDYTQMATNIANGTGGPGAAGKGHHHHHIGSRMGSDGSNSTSSSLSDLLSNAGIDPSELSSLLSSSGTSSTSSSSSTSSDASTSSSDSSSNSTDGDDFLDQLKTLLNQYGSKGNLYDTAI